jgi:hypothetical protein
MDPVVTIGLLLFVIYLVFRVLCSMLFSRVFWKLAVLGVLVWAAANDRLADTLFLLLFLGAVGYAVNWLLGDGPPVYSSPPPRDTWGRPSGHRHFGIPPSWFK